MKRNFMVALTSALLATMALAGGASAASHVEELTFESRYDVFTFELRVRAGTKVKAATRDCCFEGDNWGVLLVRPHDGEQSPPISRSACGDGSNDRWSGRVTMPAKNGKVIAHVYNCSPTQDDPAFPAGMDVRFRYDGDMTVMPQS